MLGQDLLFVHVTGRARAARAKSLLDLHVVDRLCARIARAKRISTSNVHSRLLDHARSAPLYLLTRVHAHVTCTTSGQLKFSNLSSGGRMHAKTAN
eukprot:2120581-Prymnesium_polylepis.1